MTAHHEGCAVIVTFTVKPTYREALREAILEKERVRLLSADILV
jgi:hypothetical protein